MMSYLFAILKNVVYGTSVYFTGALTESTDVLDVLALRFLLSFIVMWMLKSLRVIQVRVSFREALKSKESLVEMKTVLLAALFEPVLYMFFETMGISMTTSITTGVILSLAPIMGVIFESLVLKEHATFMQKIFLGLGIAGVIYISVNTGSVNGKDTPTGILFLFLAIASGALFEVFSRKSSGTYHAMEITYVSCFAGMVVFNIINVFRHILQGTFNSYFVPYFSLENMVGFLFLSVVSTIVATGMNNYALKRMQVSTMSAFNGISTLVTVMLGVFIEKERLYAFHYIGFALILCRMIGVSYIAIQKEKNAE